ncbi:hypothetical protein HY496_01495 [Candidatus Woesearchaeota archaeon]|nr:hypothetical protein [Candidatus Woesearchaeota archaeon]
MRDIATCNKCKSKRNIEQAGECPVCRYGDKDYLYVLKQRIPKNKISEYVLHQAEREWLRAKQERLLLETGC